MDDDGSMGMRNGWGFFENPTRNLGLQLMSSVTADRDTKQLLSNGPFLHHQHMPHHHPHDGTVGGAAPRGMPSEASTMPMNFIRNDAWTHQAHHPRESKILHTLAAGHTGQVANAAHHDSVAYGMIPGVHTMPVMQQPDRQSPPPPKEECIPPPPVEDNAGVINEPPPPKKRQPRQLKSPKPKKPKKVAPPLEDGEHNGPAPCRRAPKKTVGMVINGVDVDLSRIPTPICSCTGAPQQCYRWGAGGWQSACCTTTISTYPLPMSTKRRGARIAGRKMSQGAFKKVLEKLAGEGYNLSNPIDLKTFWAKHGTNKFVTIRCFDSSGQS